MERISSRQLLGAMLGLAALGFSESVFGARGGYKVMQAHKHGKWSPLLLTPSLLLGWWHSDDLSSSPVTTWTDRIKALALSSTGYTSPTWSSSAWLGNNTSGVTFDGASTLLRNSGTITQFPQGSASAEIWSAASCTLALTNQYLFRFGDTSTRNCAIQVNNGTKATAIASNTQNINSSGPTWTSPAVVGAYYRAAAEYGRFNGTEFQPHPFPTGVAITLNTNTGPVSLGGANQAVLLQPFGGVVKQLLVTGGLTQNQQYLMEGYLAWTGGIQANLPITHPYRFTNVFT